MIDKNGKSNLSLLELFKTGELSREFMQANTKLPDGFPRPISEPGQSDRFPLDAVRTWCKNNPRQAAGLK